MATNNNTPTPAINPQDPNATFAGAIINGIGQPGSTVSLDINGKTSIATDPVAADGTWKFVASLDSGATTITANDINAAGLEGTSDALSLNVSNTKAAPLVAFEPSATMQNATTVDLSGFALPANTALKEVDISSDGKLIGKADLKTATDLLSPNWTFSFDKGAGDFADITATAVDLAGHSTEVTCPFELITGHYGTALQVGADHPVPGRHDPERGLFREQRVAALSEHLNLRCEGQCRRHHYRGRQRDHVQHQQIRPARRDHQLRREGRWPRHVERRRLEPAQHVVAVVALQLRGRRPHDPSHQSHLDHPRRRLEGGSQVSRERHQVRMMRSINQGGRHAAPGLIGPGLCVLASSTGSPLPGSPAAARARRRAP